MENKNLIYTKMAAIMKATKAITKSERNQQQGFMFRGIDNVMNDMHDLFADNEVFILPEVLDFVTENRTTNRGGVMTFTRAKIKFTYLTTDGSSVSTINVGEAMDSGDKGMNKAMSIALKYSITQMFLIPTEEQKDPDYVTPDAADALALALQEINAATSKETLMSIYNNYVSLQKDAKFLSYMTNKRKELGL